MSLSTIKSDWNPYQCWGSSRNRSGMANLSMVVEWRQMMRRRALCTRRLAKERNAKKRALFAAPIRWLSRMTNGMRRVHGPYRSCSLPAAGERRTVMPNGTSHFYPRRSSFGIQLCSGAGRVATFRGRGSGEGAKVHNIVTLGFDNTCILASSI